MSDCDAYTTTFQTYALRRPVRVPQRGHLCERRAQEGTRFCWQHQDPARRPWGERQRVEQHREGCTFHARAGSPAARCSCGLVARTQGGGR